MKKIFKILIPIALFLFFIIPSISFGQTPPPANPPPGDNITTYTLTLKLNGTHPAGSFLQAMVDGTNIPESNCSASTDAPEICTVKIPKNKEVTLLEMTASDALFIWWTGDCTGSHDTCTFFMDADKTVTAEFKKANLIPNNNPSNSGNTSAPEVKPIILSNGGLVKCSQNCGWNELLQEVNVVINFVLFVLAIPLAAIMFVYAGILLLFSGGEAAKRTKAKEIFFGVAIGLVIAGAAWIIVHLVLSILGYSDASWIGF